jgi:anti-anti-sigma factor
MENAMDMPGTNQGFHATVRIEGPRGIVDLVGELDMAAADQLTVQLQAIPLADLARVEIDAGAVTFIDSAGLRALLVWREECEAAGVEFLVVAVTPTVERIVQIAGVEDRLPGAG